MWSSNVPLQQRRITMSFLGCTGKTTLGLKRWFFPSLQCRWSHTWITISSSEPPSTRETWTYWKETNIGAHQDDQGTREYLSWEKRLRDLELLTLEKRRLKGGSYQCLQILVGRVQGGQSQALFSGFQCQNERQLSQTWTQEIPSKHQEVLLSSADNGALAQIARRGYGVLFLDDLQKLSGHGPMQPALGVQLRQEGWTRWPLEVPYNLNRSVILTSPHRL